MYKCPLCGLECGCTWALLGHIKKVHLRSNVCPACGRVLKEPGMHYFMMWQKKGDLLHGLLWIAYSESTSKSVIKQKKRILAALSRAELKTAPL